MNWQPIETAPKDTKTEIITYGLFPGSWGYSERKYMCSISRWGGTTWYSQCDELNVRFKPSHWMPLPEPPVSKTKQDDTL
jgi:hypothetical protein